MVGKPIDPADWRPPANLFSRWRLAESDLNTVARMLRIDETDSSKLQLLKTKIEDIRERYASQSQNEAEPPPTWYLKEIRTLRRSAQQLLSGLKKIGGMAQSHVSSVLWHRFQTRMFDRGSHETSVESMVHELVRACELAMPAKVDIKAGRRGARALPTAVGAAIDLYLEFTGAASFPKSFGKNAKDQRQFTGTHARYLQFVISLVDPYVSADQIANNAKKKLRGRK